MGQEAVVRLDDLRDRLETFIACRSDLSLVDNTVQFSDDSSFGTLLSGFTEYVEAYPSVLADIHEYRTLDQPEFNQFINTSSSQDTWKDPIDVDKFLLLFALTCCSANTTRDGERTRKDVISETREELENHISRYEEQFSRIEDDVYEHTKQIRSIRATVNDNSAKQEARSATIEKHQGELQVSIAEGEECQRGSDRKIKSLDQAIKERWDQDADTQLDLISRVSKLESYRENDQHDRIQINGMISSVRHDLNDTQLRIQTWETRSLETDTPPVYSNPDILPALVSGTVQEASPPVGFRSLAEEMGDGSTLESCGQQARDLSRRKTRPFRGGRGRRSTRGPRRPECGNNDALPNDEHNTSFSVLFDAHLTDDLSECWHQNDSLAPPETRDQGTSQSAVTIKSTSSSGDSAPIYELSMVADLTSNNVESTLRRDHLPIILHSSPDLYAISPSTQARNSIVFPNDNIGGTVGIDYPYSGCAILVTLPELPEVPTAEDPVHVVPESSATAHSTHPNEIVIETATIAKPVHATSVTTILYQGNTTTKDAVHEINEIAENPTQLPSANPQFAYRSHTLGVADDISDTSNIDAISRNQDLNTSTQVCQAHSGGTKTAPMVVLLVVCFLTFAILFFKAVYSGTHCLEKPLILYSIGEGYMVRMDIYS